jgi:hypothetical protein
VQWGSLATCTRWHAPGNSCCSRPAGRCSVCAYTATSATSATQIASGLVLALPLMAYTLCTAPSRVPSARDDGDGSGRRRASFERAKGNGRGHTCTAVEFAADTARPYNVSVGMAITCEDSLRAQPSRNEAPGSF